MRVLLACLLVCGCGDPEPAPIPAPPPSANPPLALLRGKPTELAIERRDDKPLALLIDVPEDFARNSTMTASFVNSSQTAAIRVDTLAGPPLSFDDALRATDAESWIRQVRTEGGYELAWFGLSQRMIWEDEKDRRKLYQFYALREHRGEPVECRGETNKRNLVEMLLAMCGTVRLRD